MFYDTDLFLASRSPSLVVRVLSLPRGYERHHAGDGYRWMIDSKFPWVSNTPQPMLWWLETEIERDTMEEKLGKWTIEEKVRAPHYVKELCSITFRKRKHHQVPCRETSEHVKLHKCQYCQY